MADVSLYELIKQQSEQKGRPLKIICDWDECLQPVRAPTIYAHIKPEISFKQYFNDFWERAEVECSSDKNKLLDLKNASSKEKEAIENFMKMKQVKYRGEGDQISSNHYKEIYDQTKLGVPFTSIGKDLLEALKDDFIEELFIISINSKKTNTGFKMKNKKFSKTFGKFPNAKIKIFIIPRKKGENRIERWRLIKESYPSFDMYIDDNYYYIRSVAKKLGLDNLYVLPDYKCNRSTTGSNIHHVKTTVSDLEDQDFALGVLEQQLKKIEQGVHDLKTSPSSFPVWLISLLVGVACLGLILILLAKREKKQV